MRQQPTRDQGSPVGEPASFAKSRIPARNAARLFALGVALLAGNVLTGCAARNKAYPGPVRPIGEVGVVSPGKEEGFRTILIAILQIDGQDEVGEWTGGSSEPVYLLPGDHTFRLERKQVTQPTAIFLIDLVTIVQDANAALAHAEANVTFPVKPGLVHRIQYDNGKRAFYVSLGGPIVEPAERGTLKPTEDAVECVAGADRSRELWCEAQK